MIFSSNIHARVGREYRASLFPVFEICDIRAKQLQVSLNVHGNTPRSNCCVLEFQPVNNPPDIFIPHLMVYFVQLTFGMS